MESFFLTTRNIKRPAGKKPFFADEPADPSFVIAAQNSTTMDPADRLTGNRPGERWAKKIIEAAEQPDGSGDIVFLVPGFNNDAKDVFGNHTDLAKGIRAAGMPNAVFVSYSWPSKGSFLNYLEDDMDARLTAIHLVTSGLALFARFCEPGCRIRVHVMAHSMGALVVREALRASGGHQATRDAAWGITQLITYAADISANSLESDAAEMMFDCSQRYTNYFNRHDGVLATSNIKRFLSSPRLGRHGAPGSVLDKMVDVDLSDYWNSIEDNNDTGPIGDVPASHSFYRRDKKFAADIAQTLMGDADRRNIGDRSPHEEAGRLHMAGVGGLF